MEEKTGVEQAGLAEQALKRAEQGMGDAHIRINDGVNRLTGTSDVGVAQEASKGIQSAATDLSKSIISGSDVVVEAKDLEMDSMGAWIFGVKDSAEKTKAHSARLEEYGNRVEDVGLQKAASYAQGSLDTATQVAMDQRKRIMHGLEDRFSNQIGAAVLWAKEARDEGMLVDGQDKEQGKVLTKIMERQQDGTHAVVIERADGMLAEMHVDTKNWEKLEAGKEASFSKMENGTYEVVPTAEVKVEGEKRENRLLQHHTITDAFIPVKDVNAEKALLEAKAQIGETGWKKGFTPENRDVVRAALKEHGVKPETEISGKLNSVAYAETHNGNQTFKKLRVVLDNETGGKTVLSADMDKEFTQRLIAKLENAEKGQQVSIGGFASQKEKDGHTYVDHVATLKDAEGKDIPAVEGRFRAAQDIANAAIEPLKAAGIDNQEVFTKTASVARTKYFEGVLKDMVEERYPAQAKNAEKKMENHPRLDGHLKEPDGSWRSVGLYVDKDNHPRAIITLENKELGTKERLPIKLEERHSEKTGKNYLIGKSERADGSTLFVSVAPAEKGQDQWLAASFSEKRGQEWTQIKGVGGSLKPNSTMQSVENDRTAQYVKDKLGVDVLKTKDIQKSRDARGDAGKGIA